MTPGILNGKKSLGDDDKQKNGLPRVALATSSVMTCQPSTHFNVFP